MSLIDCVLKDDHRAEEEQDADAKGQEASGQATHKVGNNAKLQIIGDRKSFSIVRNLSISGN